MKYFNVIVRAPWRLFWHDLLVATDWWNFYTASWVIYFFTINVVVKHNYFKNKLK